jgi:DNA-binding NtrC family response regulator
MSDAKPLLLLVDDDEPVRRLLSEVGRREGFEIISCHSGGDALDVLRRRHVDLMLLDLHMPGIGGLDVLRATRELGVSTRIALMTGYASIDSAVEAVKLGAEDYLQKPLDLPRVRDLMRGVRHQFENRESVLESDAALAERLEFAGMIGRAPVMLELFDKIRRLAPYARSVLITGETGTGKELVARALHAHGPRADRRFVIVNCSAIVESLFESELFGHTRGAFTGATESKPGFFEAANGGTVFLDEVGELPLAVQAKLLRVLEAGEVQRVGGVEERKVDVRVVAATNRPLAHDAATGKFRNDLFYRLNVVEVEVPPLRERREDIPYLTAAFLRHYAKRFDRPITGLTPAAERMMSEARWPGNVRQLRNAVEHAVLLCQGHLLTELDVSRALRSGVATEAKPVPPARDPALPPPSKTDVVRAIDAARGNKALAARELGVSRRTLYRLIEKYGVAGGDVQDVP